MHVSVIQTFPPSLSSTVFGSESSSFFPLEERESLHNAKLKFFFIYWIFLAVKSSKCFVAFGSAILPPPSSCLMFPLIDIGGGETRRFVAAFVSFTNLLFYFTVGYIIGGVGNMGQQRFIFI